MLAKLKEDKRGNKDTQNILFIVWFSYREIHLYIGLIDINQWILIIHVSISYYSKIKLQ